MNRTMSDTTKVCVTVGTVAWLAAVVVLAIAGQPEVAVTLALCGVYAVVVFVFFV